LLLAEWHDDDMTIQACMSTMHVQDHYLTTEVQHKPNHAQFSVTAGGLLDLISSPSALHA
jgi:hypothetical protein